jgi:hypothetical protein
MARKTVFLVSKGPMHGVVPYVSSHYQTIRQSAETNLPTIMMTCVGKEMPISRIVIAVPNATVVLLD